MAFRYGAGECAVSGIFSEKMTVYRREGEGWARRVYGGVFLKMKAEERETEGGMRVFMPVMQARVLGGECPAMAGDIAVPGVGPEIAGAKEMEEMRRAGECYRVVEVSDNTRGRRLGHWKIVAQ